jgi:predicted Fe-Mo cluster-binding NifX family protein
MKIAAVSDDQQTIGRHFGRSRYFLVFTIENGEITNRELREKAGHRHRKDDAHGRHHDEHGDHHQHHDDNPGETDDAHRRMTASIQDCDVLLVGGMGPRAQQAMVEAGITPCGTNMSNAEEAVRAFLSNGEVVGLGCP